MIVVRVDTPAKLREYYPLIEESMPYLLKHNAGNEELIAPDIYKMVMDGAMSMAVVEHYSDPVGWGAWSIQPESDGTKTLHCHYMYVRPGAPGISVDELVGYGQIVAEEAAVNRLQFTTNRRGWIKRLGAYGFDVKAMVLTKEVY